MAKYAIRVFAPSGEVIRDENSTQYDILYDAVADKEAWEEEDCYVELLKLDDKTNSYIVLTNIFTY